MFISAIPCRGRALLVGLTFILSGACLVSAAEPDKKKLKIVFMMGQSNMVGYFNPTTAWYLTQPVYSPPVEAATIKELYFDWGHFYWEGIRYATGPESYMAKGKALLEERSAERTLWRHRVYGENGYKNNFQGWPKEWGRRPGKDGEGWRKDMHKFLNEKHVESGLLQRMVDHIESPENKLPPKLAIQLITKRDEAIADDLKRVRELMLKDTKAEDFDKLAEALKAFGKVTAENRMEYAKLLESTVHLPLAKRTHISALGQVSGADTPYAVYTKIAQGPLTVGYGAFPTSSGPEYPFGISFERQVDGPVLLVKCAWGGTSLHTDWRPPSEATPEKPIGDRLRCSFEHIRQVLADPGKYHPEYDPKAGYELSGLVWFQGWNDAGNAEYGKQLVSLIKDFRKEVNAPKLPVICGLLGHAAWELNTFDGDVNSGMLYAAQHEDLKGTVDVVNTVKYYPIELGMKGAVQAAFGKESAEYKEADRIITRATSKDSTHYHGSAKFAYLTGDAMARKLANLLAGGQPTIQQEADRILKGK